MPAVGAQHLKLEAGNCHHFTALRHPPHAVDHQATDRVGIVLRQRCGKVLIEIFNLGQRAHPMAAILVGEDIVFGFIKIELVVNLADDLFQHILDRHQP